MGETKERVNFTLSKAVKLELDETIPNSKRSQFVERAIAEALLAEARQRALKTIDDAPSVATGGRDSVDVLKSIRQARLRSIAPETGSAA